jgi:ketosteroid isomerase-like protein
MPNFETIIRDYLSLVSTDLTAWFALLHDDLVMEFPYGAAAGLKERLVGKAEVTEAIGSFLTNVPDIRFNNIVVHLSQDPDQAFATYDTDTVVPATMKRYRQTYITLFRKQGDSIILIREFFDPTKFVAAFHSQ